MLYLNGLSVGLSLVVTGITVFWLENLTIAIISIVFLQATRCFIPDLFLQKKMHMKYSYEVLWDALAAIVFITGNWAVGGMKGWGIYCTFVIFLMLFRMRDYKSHLQIMYGIIR